MKREYLPVDDSHLPIHERRFPYRPLPGEERATDAAAMLVVKRCEWIIVQELKRKSIRRNHEEFNDLCQLCRWHLLTHTLPRWDRHNTTKATTFCFTGLKMYIIDHVDRMRNRQRKTSQIHMKILKTLEAPEGMQDAAVERIADAILNKPEIVLTAQQAKVFNAELDRRGLKKDLARQLGYTNNGSLSTMLARIEDRIAGIDIAGMDVEDFSAELPRKVAA